MTKQNNWCRSALCLLVAIGSPACWSWSFPAARLSEGDGGISAGDTGTPAPREDALVDDTSTFAGDALATADARPAQCDCPEGACMSGGLCPAAGESTYVDSRIGCNKDGGTRDTPVCTIGQALAKKARYIWVAAGMYPETLSFSAGGDREVYAALGAVIQTPCGGIAIRSGSVKLVNFRINGSVEVATGATVTLVDNRIGAGPSAACVGVHGAPGSTLVMDRNLVHGHLDGGVWAEGSFTLTNNIIVANGSKGTDFGGARLAASATSRFVHNTVSHNHVRNGNKSAGGVYCDGAVSLANSIVWGNANAPTFGGCTNPSSLIGGDGAEPVDRVSAPWFVGDGPSNVAESYKLKEDSQPINSGIPPILERDYFGQLRSDGKPDQGAIEFIPAFER